MATPGSVDGRSDHPTTLFQGISPLRVLPLLALAALTVGVAANTPAAQAAWYSSPSITSNEATFKIPAGPSFTWTLRLWSHGSLLGSSSGTTGRLTVAVPHTTDCTFQADVSRAPAGGSSTYYSGNRATMPSCGPPSQTMAGHIFACAAGSGDPTTTEVPGGTLAAAGPSMLPSQANPLLPTAVASGLYTVTAQAPSGSQFVTCGGTATVGSGGASASESVTVSSGGASTAFFYVSSTGPPVAAGGGGPSGVAPADAPGTANADLPIGVAPPGKQTAVASTQLALTGMDAAPPLLLGLVLCGTGVLLIALGRR
ncbi:MAG: hypothetical protein ACRDY1_00590, partial [Acidimicrobiales bacterium]